MTFDSLQFLLVPHLFMSFDSLQFLLVPHLFITFDPLQFLLVPHLFMTFDSFVCHLLQLGISRVVVSHSWTQTILVKFAYAANVLLPLISTYHAAGSFPDSWCIGIFIYQLYNHRNEMCGI